MHRSECAAFPIIYAQSLENSLNFPHPFEEQNIHPSSVLQALLIYLFVELLQKCQVVQLESLKVISCTNSIPAFDFLGSTGNTDSKL